MGAWLVGACSLGAGARGVLRTLNGPEGLVRLAVIPCARIRAYAQASADINRPFVVVRTTAGWVVVEAAAAAPATFGAGDGIGAGRRPHSWASGLVRTADESVATRFAGGSWTPDPNDVIDTIERVAMTICCENYHAIASHTRVSPHLSQWSRRMAACGSATWNQHGMPVANSKLGR
jgi:hypothetical protein